MQKKNKYNNRKQKQCIDQVNTITASTVHEHITKYGSAASEYIKGYEGKDNLTGNIFDKGHKAIHDYKLHPDYTEQNLKQQAGYNAEVLKVSRENAKNIINNRPERVIRTADHPDFGKNDMVNDHVVVDSNNNVIKGLQSQMKFVDNYEQLIDKIAKGANGGKNDFSRYLNTKLDLPSDQYQQAKEYCLSEAKKMKQQASHLKNINPELAAKKLNYAKNYEKIHNHIKDSKITRKEAIEYRVNPRASLVKDVTNVAHEAGIDGAKIGGGVGFVISAINNLLLIKAKDSQAIESSTVLKNIIQDTAKSALAGYTITAGGTVLKASMEQYGGKFIQQLSKTGAPGAAVAFVLSLKKPIEKFIKGEITKTEFLEAIGQQGSNTIVGTLFMAIGQATVPIPVIGAIMGSIIGYTISSISYKTLTQSIQQSKLSKERYLKTKEACKKARYLMNTYLYKNEILLTEQSNILKDDIEKYFAVINNLIIDKEYQGIDGICKAVNEMSLKMFNKKLKYSTSEECHQFLLSNDKLIL